MTQYISKDALVAEIEKRRNICKKVVLDLRTEENKDYYQGKAEAYKETLDFLNTLEVKEVDLNEYYHEFLQKEWFESLHVRTISEMMAFTAKHFFELGMSVSNKAQKGE